MNGFSISREVIGYTPQIFLLLLGLGWIIFKQLNVKFTLHFFGIIVLFLNVLVYGGIHGISFYEDKKIEPIQALLTQGNYEEANIFYGEKIEKNPPFAGSRYYKKLRKVRYAIEYYRKYMYIRNRIDDPKDKKEWEKIKRDLFIIPQGFPEEKKVKRILIKAELEMAKIL